MQQKHEKHKAILHPSAAAKHYSLQHYKPSDDSAPFVERYWIVRWQLPTGVDFSAEILPDPNVNMSFTAKTTTITGVVTKKFTYSISGMGVVLGVKFRAGGFYPFFGRSVVDITDKIIPASNVFTGDLSTLSGQFIKQSTDAELVSRVEGLLRTKRPKFDQHLATITKIIKNISDDHSIRQVQSITKLFGISERTLQHLFRKYVGIGPKWVINRYRLQDAAAHIAKDKNDWTKIALEAGYTDQPHFIRDFRQILGETPAEYGKRRLID